MSFTSYDISLAQNVQNKYGVPASVTLAQYALESGYGTSKIAQNNNNYFGIRGSNGWAKYSSKEDSFNAYGKLLSGRLYKSKTAGAKNVTEYVNGIAETYAPSSDGNSGYSGKVLSIINKNNLTQYDDTGKYSGGAVFAGSTGFNAKVLTFILFIAVAFMAYKFFDASIGGVENIKIVKGVTK